MRGLPFSIEKQFFIGPSESRPILPLLALTNIEEVEPIVKGENDNLRKLIVL